MGLSRQSIIESLKDTYGESITSGDIKGWCSMNDMNYQTVTNKLNDYKIGRGKWNLTVQEKLEHNQQQFFKHYLNDFKYHTFKYKQNVHPLMDKIMEHSNA